MELCNLCNKKFKSLSRHHWKAHGDGLNHKPMLGKNHTKESKELIKNLRIGKSSGMKGKKGSCKSHTQETKDKISKSMRGNNNGKHRGDRQSYYKDIRMDSSWEVKVAEYLDSQNINWSYGSNVLVIDEFSSYRPDFLLDDGSYIEVKGYWREANKLKFEKVKKMYPELKIEVWDKEVLKLKNIL